MPVRNQSILEWAERFGTEASGFCHWDRTEELNNQGELIFIAFGISCLCFTLNMIFSFFCCCVCACYYLLSKTFQKFPNDYDKILFICVSVG